MSSSIPLATYRLQLTKDFGFEAAAALVPYLKELGISHLYASPFLAARPGSTHGYDIVDHTRFNTELGGEKGFETLDAALKSAGMKLILDFVPNHMGVGFSDNAWWLDVLEWGIKSPHARSFDIDWKGLPYREQAGVLLPILGKPYGDALRQGDIKLKYDAAAGSIAAWYFEHKLPINPQRYWEILQTAINFTRAQDSSVAQRILELSDHYRQHPPTYLQAPQFKDALAKLPDAAEIIAKGLDAYRGDTEQGWPLLHRLLERQAFHLAYWRVAFAAINYRRFFDINDLAGIRVEDPSTFRAIHVLVARLIAENKLQGLRIDHIDGLRDPAQYTRRLVDLIRRVRPQSRADGFYIVIEKILEPPEQLPQFTGVAGTTGYERLNLILRVLLDSNGLPALEETWARFAEGHSNFSDILRNAKHRVLGTMLASEFTVLTNALGRIAAGHFSSRDYVLDRLRAALQAYVLEFPIYRTYITSARISARDRATITQAIERARARWAGPDPDIFDFLRKAITTDLADEVGYSAPRVRDFAFKLQQFTGPLMAKSLEDTAFYRFHRLIALNEVGGEPAKPELTVAEFHAAQRDLLQQQPNGLTATATHDTKRGEDARMRILALAELPDEWDDHVAQWAAINEQFVRPTSVGRAPSRGDEYMLYQTILGSWPQKQDSHFTKRVQQYAVKAAREGKQQTSWIVPNPEYEMALTEFIDGILDLRRSEKFIESFSGFSARLSLLGALNSLSQVALKLTLPGVPDFYQGTELWDLSMVDPDNRRPVDFDLRRSHLKEAASWAELADSWTDGRIKFALIQSLLSLRAERPALFQNGSYEPVELEGADAGKALAFARRHGDQEIVVVVCRHFAAATDGGRHWPTEWKLRLKSRDAAAYRDVLHDREILDPLILPDLNVGIFRIR